MAGALVRRWLGHSFGGGATRLLSVDAMTQVSWHLIPRTASADPLPVRMQAVPPSRFPRVTVSDRGRGPVNRLSDHTSPAIRTPWIIVGQNPRYHRVLAHDDGKARGTVTRGDSFTSRNGVGPDRRPGSQGGQAVSRLRARNPRFREPFGREL